VSRSATGDKKSSGAITGGILSWGKKGGESGSAKGTASTSTKGILTTKNDNSSGQKGREVNSDDKSAAVSAYHNDLAVPFDIDSWDGGMWSEESSGPSGSVGNLAVGNSGSATNSTTKSSSASVPKKIWSVVETDADKRKKNPVSKSSKTISTDNPSGKRSDNPGGSGSGYMLGGESGSGLSWLAQMRKEWASKEKSGASSDSASCNVSAKCSPANSQEQVVVVNGSEKSVTVTEWSDEGDDLFLQDILTETISENSRHPTDLTNHISTSQHDKPNADGKQTDFASESSCAEESRAEKRIRNTLLNSQSEGEFSEHDSFHVSSCEIDEWPTPEKYRNPQKSFPASSGSEVDPVRPQTGLTSSGWLSKQKRTVDEISSCSDDDIFARRDSKRPKPAQTSSSSGGSDAGSSAGQRNVFTKVKAKNKAHVNDNDKSLADFLGNKNKRGFPLSDSSDSDAVHDKLPSTSVNRKRESEIQSSASSNQGASTSVPNPRTEQGVAGGSMVKCPSCQCSVPAAAINDHLDLCLS
jgi:hypothetical protein